MTVFSRGIDGDKWDPHAKGAFPHVTYVGCFHPDVGVSLSVSTHGAFFTLHPVSRMTKDHPIVLLPKITLYTVGDAGKTPIWG